MAINIVVSQIVPALLIRAVASTTRGIAVYLFLNLRRFASKQTVTKSEAAGCLASRE